VVAEEEEVGEEEVEEETMDSYREDADGDMAGILSCSVAWPPVLHEGVYL